MMGIRWGPLGPGRTFNMIRSQRSHLRPGPRHVRYTSAVTLPALVWNVGCAHLTGNFALVLVLVILTHVTKDKSHPAFLSVTGSVRDRCGGSSGQSRVRVLDARWSLAVALPVGTQVVESSGWIDAVIFASLISSQFGVDPLYGITHWSFVVGFAREWISLRVETI